ncbi:phosphoglycerate mutase [Verminephrobacter aporrectodeae subsp. tuberculatae]|uniref:Phosphoglycerate mutase n=1 Tax=Verminephrobacter aporrectodeae subsp. tuberculatae TaxID=1110392 RepID=A0ABT3KQT6_9BURK|nr:phosphoglycerate mutase [Verminephrobacter aporrectodeae]MCW5320284.1 phosphoglycerate mutase [Verminephrobacter aporrectodeae subsp. tuberculatae]
MPAPAHLIIAYAAGASEACHKTLQGLALPHLQRLLARLTMQPAVSGAQTSYSTPHERALAQALGLPCADGRIPWAAWHRHSLGLPADAQAWAFVTPCQWQVGADHVSLCDPEALGLDEAASRALLAIVAPWFAQDGIHLHYDQPTRWLARSELFATLATASLERALLRDLRPWLPDARAARPLHRLHSEMQMLLHTHAFNGARAERAQPPVNAFWVHGAGPLPRPAPDPGAPLPTLSHALRDAALRADWSAWGSAWTTLDAGPVAELLRQAASGQSVRLTLCGECHAIGWHSAPRGLVQRIRSYFKPLRMTDLQAML